MVRVIGSSGEMQLCGGRGGEGRGGEGRGGEGRGGEGRAGQGRAGQGRAGQLSLVAKCRNVVIMNGVKIRCVMS